MKAVEKTPQYVCISCGCGVLGPVAKSFEVFNWKACDICGHKKATLPAEIFRDYEVIFQLEEPLEC